MEADMNRNKKKIINEIADYIEYHQVEYQSIDQLAFNIVNRIFNNLCLMSEEECEYLLAEHMADQLKDQLNDQQLDQLLDQQWDQLKDQRIDQHHNDT